MAARDRPMNAGREFVSLTPYDMEAMLLTVEGSLKIYKRFQFFLWSQGSLHRFLPHETLVCAWGDVASNRFQFEVFTQNQDHETAVQNMLKPVDGFMGRMVNEWRRRGGVPCSMGHEISDGAVRDLARHLHEHGFSGGALGHGAKEITGDGGSFFLFLNVPPATGRTTPDAYMAELLMPYLHMALHRMVATEKENGEHAVVPEAVLSGREMGVLRLVRDGKTNHEIAQILDISPLTVKNHVQNILRKLKANNRAQAVAKGINSNLFTRSGDSLASGVPMPEARLEPFGD